jgi:hypothetical protein
MGHYASEMVCSKCGAGLCTCPRPRPKSQWTVQKDFTVIPTRGMYFWPDHIMFGSKQAAEEAVPDLIRKKINELEAEIDMLNTMLDLKSGKHCDKCGNVKHECFCGGGYR